MEKCPICGAWIYSSDTPENMIRNHMQEQHPDHPLAAEPVKEKSKGK